jgi:methylthioribose-1-phosphate isomerase
VTIKPFEWKNRQLFILDQTKLPHESHYELCPGLTDVFNAIKTLKVRGAPLIGIVAAYGILVALLEKNGKRAGEMKKIITEAGKFLISARPTAVNLEWAVRRMMEKAKSLDKALTSDRFFLEMEKEAVAVLREDLAMSGRIGKFGSALIKNRMSILTHCNAGGLATSGLGTALSPVYHAKEQGKKVTVYADETRPLLQGARLTCYELLQAGIKTVLICDSMAGTVIKQGKVDMVIVGADRIAANGDTANKIGTFPVAVLAYRFKVPFYVAAPASTFDLTTKEGKDIPIEERDPSEVRMFAGIKTAPENVDVFNPAFDVTDHELITAFITDRGIIKPPFKVNLARYLK